MAEHNTDSESESHEDLHHPPHGTRKYVMVFFGLCALTACSILIAWKLMETPTIAWTGMMAVSCAKASLVILFFMHLKWEANWKYVLTVPASIMAVVLTMLLIPDIGQRTRHYSEPRWLHASEGDEGRPADEEPSGETKAESVGSH